MSEDRKTDSGSDTMVEKDDTQASGLKSYFVSVLSRWRRKRLVLTRLVAARVQLRGWLQ